MDREVDPGHGKDLPKCEALKGKLPYLAQGHLPSEDWGAEVVPGGWMVLSKAPPALDSLLHPTVQREYDRGVFRDH